MSTARSVMARRTPSNATGFKFDFDFYTYEWPGFVCSTYNDFFVALLDPIPPDLADGNIAFDREGNPISVNNALLQACSPGTHRGKTFTCPLGTGPLVLPVAAEVEACGLGRPRLPHLAVEPARRRRQADRWIDGLDLVAHLGGQRHQRDDV